MRGPHDGWNTFGKVEPAGLIVKMISPACSGITAGFVIDQPPKCILGFIRPNFISDSLVQANETLGQESHAFARMTLGNTQHGPQVDRKTAHSLLKHSSQ